MHAPSAARGAASSQRPDARLMRMRTTASTPSHARRHIRHAAVCRASKMKLVFLGTPEVAATVLKKLLSASESPDASFQIAAVVSQPARPKGRGKATTMSPVEETARAMGVDDSRILCPASAKDPAFLAALESLAPDLCVTAAYGNMLPQRFLDIPKFGTLNIHPSLLPKYRGAAPVQRALEAGVAETGVSVAYTVLRCDAGPVLAQMKVLVDQNAQHPELLSYLFGMGADLLLTQLPAVFDGRGPQLSNPQDEAEAQHAAKLTKEDGKLDFSVHAAVLHNKVRGFAGWPGTIGTFILEEASGKQDSIEMKILSTQVAPASAVPPGLGTTTEVLWAEDDSMLIPCAKGSSWLQVLEVQPPTKKAMSTKAYKNGVNNKRIYVVN